VEIAAFVIGSVALVLSLVSFGWQVFTWRHERRFDVRVRIESELVPVAEGKYPITVVIENHGATVEAVQEVWLLYAEHYDLDKEPDPVRVRPPSLQDTTGEPLPPRRNVRRTYDLLGGTYAPFPNELTAVALLESGERVVSKRYKTRENSRRVALGFDPIRDEPDMPERG
jgi:hypothetical protein